MDEPGARYSPPFPMIAPQDPLLSGHNVHPATDREAMLQAVGAETVEDLFSQIPASIRLQRQLDLPGPMPEWMLERKMRGLAAQNATTLTHLSFLGGGVYEHHVPAVSDAVAGRGEYLTAYTPYQPEMSQGLLRYLLDFQIVLGRLLGRHAVNCSVYDGATALAEAAWMACCQTGRERVLVSEGVWPEYRQVLQTYMNGRGVEVLEVPLEERTGRTDLLKLEQTLGETSPATFIVQTPNQLGVIEELTPLIEASHAANSLCNVSVNPLLIGLTKSPGELGADIVTCEAQSLGLPMHAGGPYLGVVATREDFKHLLPGRIVGVCDDIKGEEALALVSEEREQHVSRDKATSHICSNQAWLALKVVIHLAWLGENGFQRLAELCAKKARYFRNKLLQIPRVRPAVEGEFFHEFAIDLPVPAGEVLEKLEEKGIFGGIQLRNERQAHPEPRRLLIAVTETKSKADLDRAATAFRAAISSV